MSRLIHAAFGGYESNRNYGTYEIVLRTFDEAGNQLRSFRSSAEWPIYPHAIAAHKNGLVWLAGAFIPTEQTYSAAYGGSENENNANKIIRLNGNNQLITDVSALHNHAPVYAMYCHPADGSLYLLGRPVDSSGNLWASGSRTGFVTLRRFNESGTETLAIDAIDEEEGRSRSLWPCFAVDSSGNIIVCYNQPGGRGIVKKYDSAGVLQWTLDTGTGGQIYSIATDGSSIYIGGTVWNAATTPGYALGATRSAIVKYDSSDGAYVAEHNGLYSDAATVTNRIGNSISISSGDNRLYSTGYNIFKIYDLSLTPIYSSTSPYIRSIGAISGEKIYVGLPPPSGLYTVSDVKQVRRYDTDLGTLDWSAPTYYEDDYPLGLVPSYLYGFAVVENAEMYAIPLWLALANPTTQGDLYSHAPGIPLGLALKAPTTLREYAGAEQPQIIYRLLISDDEGAVELPLSSINCRYSSGTVRLSVVVPGTTEAMADAIADKAEGEIAVYRGLRFRDGTEQLDELVRASITDIQSNSGSDRQPVSINAEAVTIANQKTRTLNGMSYRASDSGRRRVRGEVDTYLRPGDTLNLGGSETMIVGDMTYQIDADTSAMNVTEAES